jgi:hypothetical protein
LASIIFGALSAAVVLPLLPEPMMSQMGWRLCRFCRDAVEDECHAFLECEGSEELIDARNRAMSSLFDIDPGLRYLRATQPQVFLETVLHRLDTIELVAKFIYTIHTVFTTTAAYVPEVSDYRTIVN